MSGSAVETATIPENISGQMLELDEDEDLEVFSKDATFTDGSSFSVSMQTSPGSMVNQYRFEDDEDKSGTKDIFITVDNPESHVTAIETFITYRVLTKTTRSEFDSSEYEVRRRYQDFFWLKGKLEESHPTLIVHPLPEKFVMKGMVERFTNDFIETRKNALHRFLNRIADHPILSSSEDFKIFLTAQAWELVSHKKQGPGFLSRMSETVRAVAATVRGVKNRPEEFTAIQDYVDNFSIKLTSLDKITQRIVKEKRGTVFRLFYYQPKTLSSHINRTLDVLEYLDELKEYGPAYTLWSGSEDELVEPLKLMASCLDRCSKETEEQIEHLSNNLLPTLHEYALCAENLKAVLRRRDNIQADFEAKSESLATKRTEREADSKVLSLAWDSLVGKNPEEVKQLKEQKLKGEIKEIKEDIEKLEDRLEWANNTLKGDWSRWQKNMRADLRDVFTQTAEKNVEYYEKYANFSRYYTASVLPCTEIWVYFQLKLSQGGEDANAVAETLSPSCDTSQDNDSFNKSPVALPVRPNNSSQSTSDMDTFPINSMSTHSMTHKQNIIYSTSPSTLGLKQNQPLIRCAFAAYKQTSDESVPWQHKEFTPIHSEAKPAPGSRHHCKQPAAKGLEWCQKSLAILAHLEVQSPKNALPAGKHRSVIWRPFAGHKGVQVHNPRVPRSFSRTAAFKAPLNKDVTRPPALLDRCKQELCSYVLSAVQAETEGCGINLEQQVSHKLHKNNLSWVSDMLCLSGCHEKDTSITISNDITLFHLLQTLQSKPETFLQIRRQRRLETLPSLNT
ncbi:Sorting nexin-7 [Bagarius yarrelli]|uniref:Sorting nexin-7 n=1 Tax=Bagarius yarrelli TaxID=175774 RepID=A0A556TQ57_BAGYA|nr:Sorting nexin-7 [Bagarius yarrelli]